jgi:hypothetical protein
MHKGFDDYRELITTFYSAESGWGFLAFFWKARKDIISSPVDPVQVYPTI